MTIHPKRICILVLAAGLAAGAVTARGETMYVIDGAVVNVRSGPGTDNEVIGQVGAGQAVDLLDDEPVGEFGRVRTADGGLEGWISTRFLTAERTAGDRLREAESDLVAATALIAELEATVARLEARAGAAAAETGQAGQGGDTGSASGSGAGVGAGAAAPGDAGDPLSGAHAGSVDVDALRGAPADAGELTAQNTSLRMRVSELSQQLDVALMQTTELRDRNRQNWFLIGAAVLLAGIIIGLVAPNLRRRRRTW